jgi:hypothetical protein
MTKRPRDIDEWLVNDLPMGFGELGADAELKAEIKESKRLARIEAAEMDAFLRELHPGFYLPLPPDAFDLALEGTDELLATWAARLDQAAKPKPKREPKRKPVGKFKPMLLDGPRRR